MKGWEWDGMGWDGKSIPMMNAGRQGEEMDGVWMGSVQTAIRTMEHTSCLYLLIRVCVTLVSLMLLVYSLFLHGFVPSFCFVLDG